MEIRGRVLGTSLAQCWDDVHRKEQRSKVSVAIHPPPPPPPLSHPTAWGLCCFSLTKPREQLSLADLAPACCVMAPLLQQEPQEAWSDTNLPACPVPRVPPGISPSLGSQTLSMMELNFLLWTYMSLYPVFGKRVRHPVSHWPGTRLAFHSGKGVWDIGFILIYSNMGYGP